MAKTITTKFNGAVLEKTVPGFHTLSVSGREHDSIDISSQDRVTDGSIYLNRRIPARTITITYAIDLSQASASDAVNALNKALYSTAPVRLIFSDESDKYWTAIYSGGSLDSKYQSALSGSINFSCLEPYKKAVSKTSFESVTAEDGTISITITNDGNVPCPIDWTVTHPTPTTEGDADNGYISLASDTGEWMVFGDQAEQDTEADTKSTYVLRAATATKTFNGTADSNTSSVEFLKTGTMKIGTSLDADCVIPSAYGTKPSNKNKYYGAVRSKSFTAQSANVSVTTHAVFATDNVGSKGLIALTLNASGKTLADIFLLKPYVTDLSATAYCRAYAADGTTVKSTDSVSFGCAANASNPFCPTSDNGSLMRIEKVAGKFYFNIAGTELILTSSALKAVQPDSVSIWICRYSGNNKPVYNVGFRDLRIRLNDVEYQKDIPNRYTDGDVLKINGSKGTMRKNGALATGDEVLGSTYFMAQPGTHTVVLGCSDWCKEKPTATATIRERWI